jgi:hypothetical protein
LRTNWQLQGDKTELRSIIRGHCPRLMTLTWILTELLPVLNFYIIHDLVLQSSTWKDRALCPTDSSCWCLSSLQKVHVINLIRTFVLHITSSLSNHKLEKKRAVDYVTWWGHLSGIYPLLILILRSYMPNMISFLPSFFRYDVKVGHGE